MQCLHLFRVHICDLLQLSVLTIATVVVYALPPANASADQASLVPTARRAFRKRGVFTEPAQTAFRILVPACQDSLENSAILVSGTKVIFKKLSVFPDSHACTVKKPCQNDGKCSLDVTTDTGYHCKCPFDFLGKHCEVPLSSAKCSVELRDVCKNGQCLFLLICKFQCADELYSRVI